MRFSPFGHDRNAKAHLSIVIMFQNRFVIAEQPIHNCFMIVALSLRDRWPIA
jgi:hypothetical protein